MESPQDRQNTRYSEDRNGKEGQPNSTYPGLKPGPQRESYYEWAPCGRESSSSAGSWTRSRIS